MREKLRERKRYWADRNLDRAEAKEEGREKEGLTVAQNMKREGLDWTLIARMTGLSPSEIERLD